MDDKIIYIYKLGTCLIWGGGPAADVQSVIRRHVSGGSGSSGHGKVRLLPLEPDGKREREGEAGGSDGMRALKEDMERKNQIEREKDGIGYHESGRERR